MKAKVDFNKAVKLYSYDEYKDYVISRFSEGLATGDIHNEARMSATKINLQRIRRLDKTTKISSTLTEALENLSKPLHWYLITEGWCGDSAQITSILNKIASLSDKISFSILLRDENESIMNQYLTNGGKAIPKLIIIDVDTDEEISTWGPRPALIQEKVRSYKEEFTLTDYDEFNKNLHTWYAKDKGQAVQEDILKMIAKLR